MVRLLSGVVLAAVTLAAVLFLSSAFLRVLVCAVAALAAHEYAAVAGAGGGVSRWLLVTIVVLTCWWISASWPIDPLVLLTLALGWAAFEVLALGRTISQAAASIVAPAYLGLPFGTLVALHAQSGWRVTLLLLATVVVSDSTQFYSGRLFGRHPLAPTISPKKTIEGALGGLLGAAIFVTAVGPRALPGTSASTLAALGLGIAALGIFGDLFESRLKRTAGIKDSSSLIPGHGGVLDRVDALLFATPAFYLFLRSVA